MCCTFVFELPVKLNPRWSDEQFVNYCVNNEIAKLGKNCFWGSSRSVFRSHIQKRTYGEKS